MGFEPTVPLLTVHRFSKPAHSATLPPLQSQGKGFELAEGRMSMEILWHWRRNKRALPDRLLESVDGQPLAFDDAVVDDACGPCLGDIGVATWDEQEGGDHVFVEVDDLGV